MHRGLLLAAAIGCLTSVATFVASPAVAAGITIDYPQAGDTTTSETISVDPPVSAVTVSGSFVRPEDGTGTIVAYIDGRLDSCDSYFGNDPAAADTCYFAGVPQGSEWSFQVTRQQIERLGFGYLGEHTVDIVLLDQSQGMIASGADTVTFTIVEKSAPAASPSKPDARPGAPLPTRWTTSQLTGGSPSASSVLSATPTAQQLELSAAHVALTALVTVILLLIVGFPGLFLGNTLGDKDNYERLFGRFIRMAKKVRGQVAARNPARPAARKTPGWLRVALGMLLATVIAGFVDPGFGANLGSLRLLASVGIAFVLENLLGWWLIRRLLKKADPGLRSTVEFRFGSLVILTVAVLVSRVVGFEPGMVFGLMVGLSFGATLARAKQARVTLIGLGYAFGLAIAGWLGYSLLAGIGATGFWSTFLSETLSGLAVSGIASLPVALLPLAVLDGAALFDWKKWVWAIAYGVGLFAFLLILLPLPFSWSEVSTPLATWIALYLAYALVAVGVWAWFRTRGAVRSPG